MNTKFNVIALLALATTASISQAFMYNLDNKSDGEIEMKVEYLNPDSNRMEWISVTADTNATGFVESKVCPEKIVFTKKGGTGKDNVFTVNQADACHNIDFTVTDTEASFYVNGIFK